MQTFRDIINAWPSRAEFAADMQEPIGTVHKWFQRDSIPSDRDLGLVAAARERGLGLTLEAIAGIRAESSRARDGQPVQVVQEDAKLNRARAKGEAAA